MYQQPPYLEKTYLKKLTGTKIIESTTDKDTKKKTNKIRVIFQAFKYGQQKIQKSVIELYRDYCTDN